MLRMLSVSGNVKRIYCLDGDNIGNIIEAGLVNNEIPQVSHFSRQLTIALDIIKDRVVKEHGEVAYCAGDNILFFGRFEAESCKEFIDLFYEHTGCAASMGIGDTSREALFALKTAKLRGGGQIVDFQHLTADKNATHPSASLQREESQEVAIMTGN
jgi:hypothetical protein